MRHFNSLSVILGISMQLKPAYTRSYSSPPASDEGFIQSIEARQGSTVVIPSEFLRRGSHASAVVGSYLYIDGGEISFTDNGQTDYQYSNALLSISLSQNWTNASVAMTPNVKPTGVPSLNRPSLWYHEQEGVLYTGFAGDMSFFGNSPSLPPQSVWSFKPDGTGSGSWKQVISSDTSVLSGITQPCAGLTAYGPDSAWYLGGYPASDGFEFDPSSQVWLPGMIEFNMASKSFTNSSATEYNTNGTVLDGAMHYVPSFGHGGMVLVMGGITLPYNKTGLVSFETVSVFDPAKKEWFNQTTTGTAPSPRVQFCVAGINSTNNTYEVFIYGGWGTMLGLDAVQYDTINILTLPAFHWISVPYDPQNPRFAHTCKAVGGSQIVTVGGVDPNSNLTLSFPQANIESTYNTSADPFSQGLAIFDMTALRFVDQYTAGANAYEQSDPIKEFYSSSQNAYQQNLTPGVAALVQATNFTNTTTSTPIPTTATSTPLPSISSQPSSSHGPSSTHNTSAGMIAGSAIGALAFLASLAAGIIYFLKCQIAAASKDPAFIEEAPDTSIRTGGFDELPGEGRLPELKDQALVELGNQPLVEMGNQPLVEMAHDQRRGALEAVEIGQPATPAHVHELR